MREFIERINERLLSPLPGKEAQFKMAHLGRQIIDVTPEPGTFRQAAVLMLLFPKAGEPHTVFIQRTADNYAHSKQVGFPGGGHEEQDAGDLTKTALRETYEEIGVDSSKVEILSPLSQLYIPISKNMVFPYLGFMHEEPNFQIDPKEVEYCIEMPVSKLLDPTTIKSTEIRLPNGFVMPNVPYFDVQGHVVWGATAMILSEFVGLFD